MGTPTGVEKARQYRAAKLEATPKSLPAREHEYIKSFGKFAVELSDLNSRKFEVDHIVPLRNDRDSDGFCALHVPANLQLLDKKDNQKKVNITYFGSRGRREAGQPPEHMEGSILLVCNKTGEYIDSRLKNLTEMLRYKGRAIKRAEFRISTEFKKQQDEESTNKFLSWHTQMLEEGKSVEQIYDDIFLYPILLRDPDCQIFLKAYVDKRKSTPKEADTKSQVVIQLPESLTSIFNYQTTPKLAEVSHEDKPDGD